MWIRAVVLLLLLGTFLLGVRSSRAQQVVSAKNGEVTVRLTPARTLTGHDATVGEAVDFRTLGDVKDASGKILVPDGSRVQGYVVEAHGPRPFGRAGVLRIALAFIALADGTQIPIRIDLNQKGVAERLSAEVVGWSIMVAAVYVDGYAAYDFTFAGLPEVSIVLVVLPFYVARKIYHFLGNMLRGEDAETRPGDVWTATIDGIPPAPTGVGGK